jgi:hypothetical protein
MLIRSGCKILFLLSNHAGLAGLAYPWMFLDKVHLPDISAVFALKLLPAVEELEGE